MRGETLNIPICAVYMFRYSTVQYIAVQLQYWYRFAVPDSRYSVSAGHNLCAALF